MTAEGAEGQRTFGSLLRDRRRAGGLTQEHLAERAGLSVRAIRDLELDRVRTPQRRTASVLADALQLAGDDRVRFLAAARAGAPDDRPPEVDRHHRPAGPDQEPNPRE